MSEYKDKNILPANVKQIGTIDGTMKIYVEDYVYTYIHQYAVSYGHDEKIGVLVGRHKIIDENDVLFISGMIQGKYSRNENGMEVLSVRSDDYIDEQLEKYFAGLEIIGWVYIQPGYGDYVSPNHYEYHINNFKKEYSVLFAVDPMEKTDRFFCINEAMSRLDDLKGYFIYYDKNEGMHEYMLENRFIRSKSDDEEKKPKTAKTEISPKPRAIRQRNSIVSEQRKMVNLLGTLSAVMFLICFIMGAGLIKNDGKIKKLEKKLAAMDSSYTYLTEKMKAEGVENVFAAQKTNGDDAEIKIETSETTTETTTNAVESQSKNQNQMSDNNVSNKDRTYVVQDGDSLSGICNKFYGNSAMMNEILKKNNLSNPDMIYSGRTLYLP